MSTLVDLFDAATVPDTETLTDQESVSAFAALGLAEDLVVRVADLGYETPSPIQMQAIPPLLAGRDLLGQAATGTGKTAAFTLPIVAAMAPATEKWDSRGTAPSALILVPTRELANQVSAAVTSYGSSRRVRVLPIFGGQSYDIQLRGLQRGVDVVVATPGRALDHIRRGTLDLSKVTALVLDEADEMLAMGFIDDIETILEGVPEQRQVALFSATMPARIATVARRYLRDPVKISIAKPQPAEGAVAAVRQTAYVVPRTHKLAALQRVLAFEQPAAAIIFCRTRVETDEVTSALNRRGHRAEALHGGMSQQQRDRVMQKLRDSEVQLVVATDIAARGLDIDHLSHVFNYDVPEAPETYVHRIGRIGRAGRSGVAITMAEPRHRSQMRDLERITRQSIWPARVPSLADIESKRIGLLVEEIGKTMVAGDLDPYRRAVAKLLDQRAADAVADNTDSTIDSDWAGLPDAPSLIDIAAAALKLAAGPASPATTEEDPIIDMVSQTNEPRQRNSAPMARLWVSAGRDAGIKAGDLVGAIAGEAGIHGRDIGAIRLESRHSIVEIRADLIDKVLSSVTEFQIRGQDVSIRKDREGGPSHTAGSGKPFQKSSPKPFQKPFRKAGYSPRRPEGERGEKPRDHQQTTTDRPRFGKKPRWEKRAPEGRPAAGFAPARGAHSEHAPARRERGDGAPMRRSRDGDAPFRRERRGNSISPGAMGEKGAMPWKKKFARS